MNPNYDVLTTPWNIGNVQMKNRIVITSMGGTSMIDWLMGCKFNEKLHDYFIERAQNEVGLIIPGITTLRSIVGDQWLYQHPEVFEPVKPFMEEIHSYGTKVFFQLTAGMGRAIQISPEMIQMAEQLKKDPHAPKMNMNALLVAPDDGAPNVWMPEVKMRGLTKEEIHEYVHAYAQTALLCKNAGVDGVEIHAVHEGYLLDQFTLKYSNHRTDEYGGSFENRYRFAVEVVKAIKEVCGDDYPVSLRYSVTSKTKGYNQGALPGEEFAEAGRDMQESERAIKYLEEAGYDMFNADNGTYDAWYWAHPPVYMPLNCNLKEVAHIKKYTTKPVICAGRMQMDTAAEAIRNGDIDAVGIARQSLCDPEFYSKLLADREEDIKPCISCQTGCMPVASYKGSGAAISMAELSSTAHCALTPRTLEERKYQITKSASPKKIAVIGGGIGGMEAAIQSTLRGHQVTIYEKSNELGGVFIAAAEPSFKEKDRELLEWYRRQIAKHPINVVMNKEVTDLNQLDADEIIIATGGKSRKLNLPHFDQTIEAIEYLRGYKQVGETVAIIGGGLTGCEIAYDLALKGKKPFIIEMQDDLIKVKGICAANSTMLRDLLNFHEVPVYLEASVKEIKNNAIVIDTKDGEKELPCDSIIRSVGYVSGTDFDIKDHEHIHVIGDAHKVGNLKTVIWEANDLVLDL